MSRTSVGPVEREPDVRIHRAGRVDVAHPVVAVGVDAEPGERLDEHAGEVAGVARVAVAGRVGDVAPAGGPSRDRWRRASGAPGRPSGRGRRRRTGASSRCPLARSARTIDVEDDRAAQAADVDRPGRRLGVVDDLRAADPGREFVSPVHRAVCRARALGDADDLVGEVAGGDLHDDLLALLLAEQGAPDRALVRDPALGRLRLGGADDRERLRRRRGSRPRPSSRSGRGRSSGARR